jgi:hypothetical protein
MTESHEKLPPDAGEHPAPPDDAERREDMYPASHPDSSPRIPAGRGGYDDRDPAKEMPRVPSAPETQDD